MKGYKNITDFGNKYQISRGGVVINKKSGRTVKTFTNNHGREMVTLSHKGEKKMFQISRLVAMTWIPCDDMDNKHVHHKNGDYTDNRVSNLKWVTHEEHKVEHQIMREFMVWAATTQRFKEYREVRLHSLKWAWGPARGLDPRNFTMSATTKQWENQKNTKKLFYFPVTVHGSF